MVKKTIVFISLFIVMLFVSACGGGGGSADTSGSSTTVTVERGPVYNATVRDANGQTATNIQGTNQYVFASAPVYPITASGGQVDSNYDGKIDTNDYPLTITLKAEKGLNITPMTTYLSDLDDAQKSALADKLGVKVDDLYTLPSESNGRLVAAINAAFSAEYTVHVYSNMDLKSEFDSYFDTLKQEAIASSDETSDNITTQDLADMEEYVNSQLGISPLSEEDIAKANDNVTTGGSDNPDDFDNVTGGGDNPEANDNVTGGGDNPDDFDNVTQGGDDNPDDFDNITGGGDNPDDFDNVTGSAS